MLNRVLCRDLRGSQVNVLAVSVWLLLFHWRFSSHAVRRGNLCRSLFLDLRCVPRGELVRRGGHAAHSLPPRYLL